MRIIHTADWHLGRIFYERYLTEDQAYTLQDFSALVHDYRPDAVVVAGDIYDRAVPPTDAVHLWDDMVTELSYADIPFIAISGNHDSTDRLSYGSRLLRESGVYIYGMAEADTAPLVLEDAAGRCVFARLRLPIRRRYESKTMNRRCVIMTAYFACRQSVCCNRYRHRPGVLPWRMPLWPAAARRIRNGRFPLGDRHR